MNAWNPAQRLNHEVAAGLIFGRHPLDAVLARLERAYRGVLYKSRWATAELLQQQQHGSRQLGRRGAVADAPAGHGVGLGETINNDGPRASAVKRRRTNVPAAVVNKRFVNFIADEHEVARDDEIDDRPKLFARKCRADWVPRIIEQK